MTLIAQVPLEIPDIAWSAIAPQLTLFAVGLLALLLDIAGENRLRSSALAFVLLGGGAGLVAWETGAFAGDADAQVALPALVALAGAAQLGLTWVWQDRPRMLAAIITGLGFAGTVGVIAWQWTLYRGEELIQGRPVVGTDSLIADMVVVDGVALFTGVVVCLAGLITVLIGYDYAESRRIHRGEYYPLLAFAATGMTLLVASADLIMVFISIEILSLALYILCAFARRDLNSQESALKYFLLGAFSSALLLYGIALTYGVAGTTNIAQAGRGLAAVGAPAGLVMAALGLLAVGFAFKTALVPFHMWTPDVYQGAPTPITGFMAAATKAAAFAAFLRVFVGGFGALQWTWVPALWVLAALTMLVGAVLAVVQSDLKRMLGYSAISHAGYLLIGVIAVSRAGISSLLFYLMVYALMSAGSFGVLALLEQRRRKAVSIADLRGLGKRYPIPAGMLALFLLSLAGVPGTGGFMAKLGLFRAGVAAGQTELVIVAVVSSVIAAFFYIRVIVAMFMEDEPADAPQASMGFGLGARLGLAASAAGVVVLGVLPAGLLELARQAASLAP